MMFFVGLGNPGTQYEDTRHNIGFKVIDALHNHFKARDSSKNAFHGILSRTTNSLFLKPTTFMNLSGKSVQAVKQFFKVELEYVIVIHDDIDLPFGAVRFKRGGGHGGHNGLKSIDEVLTKEYIRIRIGVGKPEYKSQVSDYVLGDFSLNEKEVLPRLIHHLVEACIALEDEELIKIKSCYSLKSIEDLKG